MGNAKNEAEALLKNYSRAVSQGSPPQQLSLDMLSWWVAGLSSE